MKIYIYAVSLVGFMMGLCFGDGIRLEPKFESLKINAPQEKKQHTLFTSTQIQDRINVTFAVKLPKGAVYKRSNGTVVFKGIDATKKKIEGTVDKFFVDTMEEYGVLGLDGKDKPTDVSVLFTVKIKEPVAFPIRLKGEMPININAGQQKLPSVEFEPKEGSSFSVGETKIDVTSVSTNDKKVSTIELTVIEKTDVIELDLESADASAKDVEIQTRNSTSWTMNEIVQKTLTYEVTNLPKKLKLTITEAAQAQEVKVPINVSIDPSSEKVATFH